MMKKIIILALLITSIFTFANKPRNLQKILQGLDQKTRFAEVNEKATNKASVADKAQAQDKISSGNEQSDAYKSLIQKIFYYADELAKSRADPEIRKIKAGQLSNFYPKAQRDLAQQMILDRRKKGEKSKYIDQPYRFCIFPYSEINAMTFCDQNFNKINPMRGTRCKHMMCINCCGHIQLILKYVTSQSIVSDVLGLADDAGFNKIKQFVTKSMINKCRKDCNVEYKVEEPIILPPPPKDIDLGTSKEDPAQSCIDIIKYGGVPRNDKYHILRPEKDKDPFMVYCDQKTDGGGWTLFFSYSHHPYEDYQVNPNEIPTDHIHGRSHIKLSNTGFIAGVDVIELKFNCVTSHQTKRKMTYMHFKSRNSDLVKVSFNEDQAQMKVKSWKKDATPLDAPDRELLDDEKWASSKAFLNTENVGQNADGGLWNRPFSSQSGSWCVKGGAKSGGIWECGDNVDPENGTKYETLHNIYFRGNPPTEDYASARHIAKVEATQQQ